LLRRYVIARSPSAQNVRELIQFTRNIEHCHKRIGQKLDSDLEERVFHFFQEFIILVKKPFRKHTPQDISPKVTQGRLIYGEMLHTRYRNNNSEWDKLEPKRRKFFVDTFCNQDLPVIEIPPKGYNGRCAISKFSKETKNRIQWHGECASKGGQYTVEQLFDLNFALQDHGLPMRWSRIYESSGKITQYALGKYQQGDPRYAQMLYNYFIKDLPPGKSHMENLFTCFAENLLHPVFIRTADVRSDLLILFFKADLSCSAELEFDYVSDDFYIRFIELYGSLSKPTANQKKWLDLFIEEFCETSPEETFVINEKLKESGIPMVWTDGMNPEILECAKTKPEYERLLCSYFKSLGDEAFSFESLDELVENFYKRYSQDVKAWQ
jgi:hypothetical protein